MGRTGPFPFSERAPGPAGQELSLRAGSVPFLDPGGKVSKKPEMKFPEKKWPCVSRAESKCSYSRP